MALFAHQYYMAAIFHRFIPLLRWNNIATINWCGDGYLQMTYLTNTKFNKYHKMLGMCIFKIQQIYVYIPTNNYTIRIYWSLCSINWSIYQFTANYIEEITLIWKTSNVQYTTNLWKSIKVSIKYGSALRQLDKVCNPNSHNLFIY